MKDQTASASDSGVILLLTALTEYIYFNMLLQAPAGNRKRIEKISKTISILGDRIQ